VTWFWFIALQWSNGYATVTNSGTGTLSPGQVAALGTREAAFAAILAGARRDMCVPSGPVTVMAYSLEPNALRTGGSELL